MSLQPKQTASFKAAPTAFRDFKAVEWTVGNISLDSSKLSAGQEIPAFTAVYQNDNGLYELVTDATPDTMKGAVVTTEAVKIEDKEVNELVPAVRKAALIEARCHGVSENFKKAAQGRITFDI